MKKQQNHHKPHSGYSILEKKYNSMKIIKLLIILWKGINLNSREVSVKIEEFMLIIWENFLEWVRL